MGGLRERIRKNTAFPNQRFGEISGGDLEKTSKKMGSQEFKIPSGSISHGHPGKRTREEGGGERRGVLLATITELHVGRAEEKALENDFQREKVHEYLERKKSDERQACRTRGTISFRVCVFLCWEGGQRLPHNSRVCFPFTKNTKKRVSKKFGGYTNWEWRNREYHRKGMKKGKFGDQD